MFSIPAYIGLGVRPTTGGATSIIVSITPISITIASGSTSNTQTITAVNTSNAALFYQGQTNSANDTNTNAWAHLVLTNGTTVTATRNASTTTTVTVKGTVVEFTSAAIQSIQAGTITMTAVGSNTATISSVTTANSICIFLGQTATSNNTTLTNASSGVVLTNATTVTANRGNTAGNATVSFMIVEFKAAVLNNIQPFAKTLTTSSLSDTQTITSVNTANTLLVWGGDYSQVSAVISALYEVVLTNSTTLTFTRTGTSSTTKTINVTVLEFASSILNSMQRGTTSNASTSATATITAVNTAKAFSNYVGFNTNAAANNYIETNSTVELTNSTTVTSRKASAGTSTSITSWEVPEFI